MANLLEKCPNCNPKPTHLLQSANMQLNLNTKITVQKKQLSANAQLLLRQLASRADRGVPAVAQVPQAHQHWPQESFLEYTDCTFKNASISPTAGIKSGMNGFSLWSRSINWGVYLGNDEEAGEREKVIWQFKLKIAKRHWPVSDQTGKRFGAKSGQWGVLGDPSAHLLMYWKSSLISAETGKCS